MTQLRDLKRGDIFRFVNVCNPDRGKGLTWVYLGEEYYRIPGESEMYHARGDPEVDIVTKSKGSTS